MKKKTDIKKESENKRRVNKNYSKPFYGIRFLIALLIIFLLVITVGIFVFLFYTSNVCYESNDIDILNNAIDKLISLQAITLTVTGISVSLISIVTTIMVFYREKKTEFLNEQVEEKLSEIKAESEFVCKLIYLTANQNNRYLLGSDYRRIIELGFNICNSNTSFKHQLIIALISILETKAISPKENDKPIINIYNDIILLSGKVLNDQFTDENTRIKIVLIIVNAYYKLFRNEYEQNPDETDVSNLNKAIEILNKNKIKDVNDDILSSAEHNLMGLVYYWKFNYLFKNSCLNNEVNSDEINQLLKNSKTYFEQAIAKNRNNEQIYNNFGCCLIGVGKYYSEMKNYAQAKDSYRQAIDKFEKAIKINSNYEKPYINLIDIQCLRIRLELKLTQYIYLLRPVLYKEEIDFTAVKDMIEVGEEYINNSKKSGKMLYNIYYKIAELKTYKLMVFLKEGKNINKIKSDVLKCIEKSKKDKATIKSLIKERQLYELCDEKEKMMEINELIRKYDFTNAEKWTLLVNDSKKTKMSGKLTGYPSIDKPWLKYYTEEETNYVIPKCKLIERMYHCTEPFLDQIALEYFNKKITYKHMRRQIETVAKALKCLGIEKGEVVSVCLPNVPEVVYLFYAINKVGGVANLLDPRSSENDFLNMVKDAKTKWLFCIDTALEKYMNILKSAGLQGMVAISALESLSWIVRKIAESKDSSLRVSLSEQGYCKLMLWREFEKLGKGQQDIAIAEYEHNAPAVIAYTGGTTGAPKGAVMSDYNFNAYIEGVVRLHFDAKPGDKGMVVAPPWTMYGISNSVNAYLCMGFQLLLVPKSDKNVFASQIIQNHPNHIVAVPSALRGLINCADAKKEDLSYIKTIILGAEKLDETFEKEANDWLKTHQCSASVTKGYGMTELGAAICYTKGESNYSGTVGIPYITDVVSAFSEKEGEYVECKTGEQGEIAILSPKCMLGYFGSASQQTGDVLIRHKDGNVWVHTGDMGHVDENGCVYIDGRIKRMFTRNGYKIFPAAIETVIARQSDVKDCAVVAIKDTEDEYIAKAFLVLKEGADAARTIDAVRKLCVEYLYSYEVPDMFEIIERLPLTNIGKVDYRSLESQNTIRESV